MIEDIYPKSVRDILKEAFVEDVELFAAFPRNKWEKARAWFELHQQDKGQVWYKCHTTTHWCWYSNRKNRFKNNF